MPYISKLSVDECEQLLRSSVLGRVVIAAPERPEVFPVNYQVVGSTILVRTEHGSLLDRWADRVPVLLEVDDVDHERWHGWSVVARCRGQRVPEEQLTDAERAVPGPPPWVSRETSTYVRLRWEELTGRRLGAGPPKQASRVRVPVRWVR